MQLCRRFVRPPRALLSGPSVLAQVRAGQLEGLSHSQFGRYHIARMELINHREIGAWTNKLAEYFLCFSYLAAELSRSRSQCFRRIALFAAPYAESR